MVVDASLVGDLSGREPENYRELLKGEARR
jgi:hypothetical protein